MPPFPVSLLKSSSVLCLFLVISKFKNSLLRTRTGLRLSLSQGRDISCSFGFSFRCGMQAKLFAVLVYLVLHLSSSPAPFCLLTRVDRIGKLFLPQKSVMKTTWGVLDPPVGNTRLNVIRLISSLLQTNTSSINGDLMELNSIGVILVRLPRRDVLLHP